MENIHENLCTVATLLQESLEFSEFRPNNKTKDFLKTF